MKTSFLIISAWFLLATYSAEAQQAGAPQLSGTNNSPLNYREDDDPAALLPELIITDDNSQQMKMATFQFGDNYSPEVDRLVFEETQDVKVFFDQDSGILYLLAASARNGVSTSVMQSAMRNVGYQTVSDDPGSKDILVSVTVTDLEGNRSGAIGRTVRVEPVSDPPVLSSDRTTPQEASPGSDYEVFPEVEIEDPDSDLFSRAVIEIVDSNGLLDELSVDDDTDLEIEEEARKITISGEASLEEYQEIIESVEYEYPSFFSREEGVRRIRLELTDAEGVRSNFLSRYFIIQPIVGRRIDIPPSLENLTAETDEGQTFNFETRFFEEGFNDSRADRLSAITIESLPRYGKLFLGDTEFTNQLIINDPVVSRSEIDQLRYVPDPFYNGEDSFRWNARDQENFAANEATIIIEIVPVNQAPDLSLPEEVVVDEDTPTPINNISLEDPDREEMKIELDAKNGGLFLPELVVARNLVTFSGNKQNGEKKVSFEGPTAMVAFALSGLIYQPDINYTGSDFITVKVDDQQGGNAQGQIDINIRSVNDSPELVDLEETVLTYTENEPSVPITATLSLSDEENDFIASATVSISQGYDASDTLIVENNDGISSTYDEGVLSLSGNAAAAIYQEVLRSTRFLSRGDNPSPGSRTISFTATDTLGAESEKVSRGLEVVTVNDAPELANLEENQLGFISGGSPVNITNELTITDQDNQNLTEATIAFGDNYDAAIDTLEYIDGENITGNWDEDAGILTLEGTASVMAYQKALRSVLYRNQSSQNVEESRTVRIFVSDGEAESAQVERELVPNQPPLISSFEIETDEEQVITFNAADFPFQDTDNFPEGELFGIIITELPEKAVLTLNNDTLTADNLNQVILTDDIEQLEYRPLADANGVDRFSWNASDGASFSDSDAQVNITINPIPDAPVVTSFMVETEEDQSLSFTSTQFSEATSDPDGDALASVIIRTTPVNGQLLLNDIVLPANSQLGVSELDQLTYLPSENFAGEDKFSWSASDGDNTSSQSAEVSIIVNPVNDAPIISSFTRAITEGEPYNFRADDFAQNYVDIEGAALAQIRIVSLPENGTLLLDGSALSVGAELSIAQIAAMTYQPGNTSGNLSVSFEWNASDGTLFSESSAQVNIIIGQAVTNFSITALEDEEYNFSRLQFANNYGNPNEALQTIRIEELPENGSLLFNNEAVEVNQEIRDSEISQLLYTPNENFSGEDSFSWNASGGSGYAEQAALVEITVDAVNDAPFISTIADQSLVAGSRSEPISFQVSDLETEAESLSITVFSGNENIIPTEQINVEGSGSNRSLTVRATEGSEGEITVSVVVSDGDQQSEAQFSVEIVPYNIDIAVEQELEICSGESGSLQLSVQGGQPPYRLQTVCAEDECPATYSEGVISFEPQVSTTYFISLVDENGIRSNVDTVS